MPNGRVMVSVSTSATSAVTGTNKCHGLICFNDSWGGKGRSFCLCRQVATSPGHMTKKLTHSFFLLQISANWDLLSSETPGNLPVEFPNGCDKYIKCWLKRAHTHTHTHWLGGCGQLSINWLYYAYTCTVTDSHGPLNPLSLNKCCCILARSTCPNKKFGTDWINWNISHKMPSGWKNKYK